MPDERADQIMRTTLLLSLQRALVGAVPPSLRAVTCGWTETSITIRYIFDGPIDPDEEDDILVVGAEVYADFPPDVSIDDRAIRVDYPGELVPHMLQQWVYMRKEAPPRAGEQSLPADEAGASG